MHIGVCGSGYLGTVISSCLADFGLPVTCYDQDEAAITSLMRGEVPYYERNLLDITRRNLRAGRLVYTTDRVTFLRRSTVIFLAQDDGSQVEQMAFDFRTASHDALLIVASPVAVGTATRLEGVLKAAGNDMVVVSHPIFLTNGCAVEDFNWPDRILLGTSTYSSKAVLTIKQIYRPLMIRGVPVIVTNHETAELARMAATAFYATKTSFINELATLCEHVNADAVELALALGLDKKIAPRCLQPGAVYGGPFAETQMDSLAALAQDRGLQLNIMSAAREVNRTFSDRLTEKITRVLDSLDGKQLGILGLAFKPNTNSIAGSSSILLARMLTQRGAVVRAYDPAAIPAAMRELEDSVRFCENAYSAVEKADALIVSTGWPEFRALDFDRIRKLLRRPVIFDTKNLLDSDRLRSMGFLYVGMGRA